MTHVLKHIKDKKRAVFSFIENITSVCLGYRTNVFNYCYL